MDAHADRPRWRYVHCQPPNKKACTFGGLASQLYERIGVSLYHPGGVNRTFGDGSARFIKNAIEYNPWLAIGPRAGIEAISADAP